MKNNLEGKNVLLTGGTGFLGQYIFEELLRSANVRSILTTSSSMYNFIYRSDICDALEDSEADIVIHLAAVVGGIGANKEHPAEFFYDNAVMGIQLIHESWLHGVEKFITVGTVCSYPKFTEAPFKEEDLWKGYPEETNAPYGLAKKMLLVQGQAYRDQYGFNSIYLIPTNLYGPGDNFNPESSHVIPALIKKFVEAKEQNLPSVTAWGTGTPTREFLYVKDAAKGIVDAAKYYNSREPVNLGSGAEVSIKRLTELIASIVGYDGKIEWDTSKPDGQPRRFLDVSKAKKEFSFATSMTLIKGLEKTVSWYLEERECSEKMF